ncbi:MAG: 6,7-dimethyl-8-ribityllumazine synthase [Deltaproteobacteria bacterium]
MKQGDLNAAGLRFGIIVSRWNSLVTNALLDGALRVLELHGADQHQMEVIRVPGCFEIPLAAKLLARQNSFDALVCLGAVVRGETTHHEYIASEVSSGIQKISQEFNVPIGFGILTTETMDQALQRAGGKAGNKGEEAALAAIEMANLVRCFKKEL